MVIRRNLVILLFLSGGLVACSSTNGVDKHTQPEVSDGALVSNVSSLADKPSGNDIEHVKAINGKLILGKNEWVNFPTISQSFRAVIDTGTMASSINTKDMTVFDRNGSPWVSFKIASDEQTSDELTLPVERWVEIPADDGVKPLKQPVVVCWIKLGSRYDSGEFTLADRNRLDFPILLGRRYLNQIAIVDDSRRYVQGDSK